MMLCGCAFSLPEASGAVPSSVGSSAQVSQNSIAATETTAPPDTAPSQTQATQLTQPTTIPVVLPEDTDFVCVSDHIATARIELAYATRSNFTGTVIYNFDEAFLRYGTLMKLAEAARRLEGYGYGIVIWDAYRPVYAQQMLWDICPDPAYVSKPGTGSQSHCRGIAVDLSLYELQSGELLEMPTGFDDFSALADRDYIDCSDEARANAILLETVMEECGFKPYRGEWWHFSDTVSYDIEYDFDPAQAG